MQTSLIASDVIDLVRVGSGGFGIVFRAYHTTLQRFVAIKVLATADEIAVSRFSREVKALCRLDHPNIVKVFSCGHTAGNHPYLVMEYVEGHTLAALVEQAPLSIEQIKPIFLDILRGIQAMHSAGFIHRDLNPNNCMVGADNTTKIIDFGLVKSLSLPHDQRITKTMQICGALGYVSPEACLGEPADVRSDIYSLGCLLYFLCTGQAPFTGSTPEEFAIKHVHETHRSVCENSTTSLAFPQLERVLNRCLAKDPAMRYQTVKDLRNDLDGIDKSIPKSEFLNGEHEQNKDSWIICTLVLLLVGVMAIVFGMRNKNPEEQASVLFHDNTAKLAILKDQLAALERKSESGSESDQYKKAEFDKQMVALRLQIAELLYDKVRLHTPSLPGDLTDPCRLYALCLSHCHDKKQIEWICNRIKLLTKIPTPARPEFYSFHNYVLESVSTLVQDRRSNNLTEAWWIYKHFLPEYTLKQRANIFNARFSHSGEVTDPKGQDELLNERIETLKGTNKDLCVSFLISEAEKAGSEKIKLKHFRDAVEQSKALRNPSSKSIHMLQLAQLAVTLKQTPQVVLQLSEEGRACFEKTNARNQEYGQILLLSGDSYQNLGRHNEACSRVKTAWQVLRKWRDKPGPHASLALANLTRLAQSNQYTAEDLRTQIANLENWEDFPAKYVLISDLSCALLKYKLDHGNEADALPFLKEKVSHSRAKKQFADSARLYARMCRLYYCRKNYAQAETYGNLAIKDRSLVSQCPYDDEFATSLIGLAYSLSLSGHPDAAQHFLTELLSLCPTLAPILMPQLTECLWHIPPHNISSLLFTQISAELKFIQAAVSPVPATFTQYTELALAIINRSFFSGNRSLAKDIYLQSTAYLHKEKRFTNAARLSTEMTFLFALHKELPEALLCADNTLSDREKSATVNESVDRKIRKHTRELIKCLHLAGDKANADRLSQRLSSIYHK